MKAEFIEKTRIAIVRNIGFAIGSVIFRKLFSSLQPSIFAASSSSRGMPERKVRSSSILNGILIAVYTIIRLHLVSTRPILFIIK